MLLRFAGFDSVRVTAIWAPGLVAPAPDELRAVQNVVAGGALAGIRVYVSVYASGSRTTPLTPEAQQQFAQFTRSLVASTPLLRDVIVGNEPNLNRFWLPQFNPDGSNAAAPAYLSLLAQTYDAVKAANPAVRIWGGALAARGNDRPGGSRETHSPVKFIRDLGLAYRASGRQLPVMDGLAHHPYPGDSSRSPEELHPNSTTIGLADYDRLVVLLAEAFDGTAQRGSTLPIVYAEFGIESIIPAVKAKAYTGVEPTTTRPVPEIQQADSYARAIRLAFCQPNVQGILLFHSHDEAALPSWQSGIFYVDGTPKASYVGVRDALARARGGSIGQCDGLSLPVRPLSIRYPPGDELARGSAAVRFRCDLDCAYTARLLRGTGAVRTVRSYARAGATVRAVLAPRAVRAGSYRVALTVVHPLNPGPEANRQSGSIAVR